MSVNRGGSVLIIGKCFLRPGFVRVRIDVTFGTVVVVVRAIGIRGVVALDALSTLGVMTLYVVSKATHRWLMRFST